MFQIPEGQVREGQGCGFSHSKDDPSKGDLEIQWRMAEKKIRESSGRDAATGVVLGGDRLKVLLAPVVVEVAEIGDTVKAAVLPNTPNALCAGRRWAQQSFSFVWRPWEAKPEIWAPDGTPIECTTDEHFVPTVRRTKTPPKAAPVVESVAAGSADTRPVGDHEGVAGSSVAVDDLVSSIGYIGAAGDSADCRECMTTMMLAVQRRTTGLQGVPGSL